jgi:hypothetical protein
MRRLAAHALALVLFAAATTAWLWPLLIAPAAAIPGSGAGDNFVFVWNLWWAKRSLLAGVSPLWCPVVFVPFGANLTLHTHTLLPSAIAALVAGDVIAGTNGIVAAHLFLNFAAGYALAWRITRDWAAALLGGLLFGWSPYVAERLLGHFNLIAVWVLPLTVLLLLSTLDGTHRRSGLLLGLTLGAIPYIEYYYAVHAAILVVVLLLAHVATMERSVEPAAWQRRTVHGLAGLVAIALLIVGTVLITGGTVVRLAGLTISLRSAGNPLAAAWLLSLIALAIAFGPGVRVQVNRALLGVYIRRLLPAAVVAVIVALPLLAAGVRLWMHGGYVSQAYLWRSAPKGIDLATLVLGDPSGAAWGDGPLRAYGRFGIEAIEQTAWFSPAALCLCAIALWRRSPEAGVRIWVCTAIAFLVWALGPYVTAFGTTLPLPLPAILIRYIPVVDNARIPARAIVVVYLAVAMLAATGFAALRERRHTAWAFILLALVAVDIMPARPALFAIERPSIYDTLRQRPEEGALCELPLGVRDGFGETGRLDMRVLFFQSLHQRPITGGFAARLDPRIVRGYNDDPVLGVLLRLSGGSPLAGEHPSSPDAAADSLLGHRIRFVMLNEDTAPPDLTRYVTTLPLRTLAREGQRTLYEVVRPLSGSSGSPSR